MFSTLKKLKNNLEKKPVKLTNNLEKEYNFLIEKVNKLEEKARAHGAKIPGPAVLNREGADATLVNDPNLSAFHLSNYLAVQRIIEGIIQKKKDLAKLNILGVGEGSGIFAYSLSSTLKPKQYLATDYQGWLVDYGRQVFSGGSLEFKKLDATAMNSIPDGSFNVVVACEFIEHISSENLIAFLKESRRVLKKDGLMIATTINRGCHPGEKFSGYPPHFTEFTAEELNRFIEEKLSRVFSRHSVFHLDNKKISQERRRGFFFEQIANFLYRNVLTLFPKGSKREQTLDKISWSLYKIRGGETKRAKLSFPREYNQTRLTYKPKDETQAFGLCLVMQA